jgi:uncharacterized membrane protein YhaH (DUF805 family)
MQKFLVRSLFLASLLSAAESWALPPCPGSYNQDTWTNCQGTGTFADGGKYVGEFKDGKLHGQGTGTWADGGKYVGEWKGGEVHGQGTFTFSDGDKYVGEWKDDKRHGQGTGTSASGEEYVGEWKDDKRHGQGTGTFADGSVEEGVWENDEFLYAKKVTPRVVPTVKANDDEATQEVKGPVESKYNLEHSDSLIIISVALVVLLVFLPWWIWRSTQSQKLAEGSAMYLMFQPLRKFRVASGRARRKEYFLYLLFFLAVLVMVTVIDMVAGTFHEEAGIGLLSGLVFIISVVPGWALAIRRLHDIDKSGCWLLLNLIPVLGGIWVLVLACLKGTPGENRFGEDPLQSNLDSEEETKPRKTDEMYSKSLMAGDDRKQIPEESVEAKLRKIEQMFEKSLITEEERKKMRDKVLGL